MERITWRFLETGAGTPYMNMAVDEAVLRAAEPGSPPVFRFFRWICPSVSIGINQPASRVLNLPRLRRDNVPFVRRPTGGGIVFHGADITYSVVLPETVFSSVRAAYIWIQTNLLKGIKKAGLKSALLYGKINKPDIAGMCFMSPNLGDIMAGGRKLGGLAARKMGRKLLFQGYIYCRDAGDMAGYCIKTPALARGAVCLGELGITAGKVIDAVVSEWDGEAVFGELSCEEEKLASLLNRSRYSSDEWNLRRKRAGINYKSQITNRDR